QFHLSTLYENGQGVTKDIQKAIYWNIKAAENGNIEAQYQLGYRFLRGMGVEADINLAKRWITSAAAKKHPDANTLLKQLSLPPGKTTN
ncbi:MAG TPA: tetratricopeptide repeat protein, partial [Clostridia bacterium]